MIARALAALLAGLLFGAGLTVSQMINPAKVLGFLDLGGIPANAWDPSLALVMAGALAITGVGFALVLRRPRPLLAPRFALPGKRDIDGRLIAGAALFGLGWGLAGYCPGPAVAALALGATKTLVFVAAMIAGMAIYELFFARRNTAPPAGMPEQGDA